MGGSEAMRCGVCGSECVRPAEEVLEGILTRYQACPSCAPEPNLNKSARGTSLPGGLSRCKSCGKATLDAVMLDALRLLERFSMRDENDSLRSVGTPLIEIGYPLVYPPRLGEKSLIISGERISRRAAEAMIREIPEIKGVILSRGVAGMIDSKRAPQKNELLAGCDMRADVVTGLFGELVIYRNQSRIHVEFSKSHAPKMQILEQLYFQEGLRDVADCLCGPGTLGLMCALAGAGRVVLNDAWRPAIEDVLINLEANRSLLGIEEIEHLEPLGEMVADEPLLVARASGRSSIEVYHGDLEKLFSRAKPADLCLIDHFPGADTKSLETACRACKRTVII